MCGTPSQGGLALSSSSSLCAQYASFVHLGVETVQKSDELCRLHPCVVAGRKMQLSSLRGWMLQGLFFFLSFFSNALWRSLAKGLFGWKITSFHFSARCCRHFCASEFLRHCGSLSCVKSVVSRWISFIYRRLGRYDRRRYPPVCEDVAAVTILLLSENCLLKQLNDVWMTCK